jgi:hypothetical protein
LNRDVIFNFSLRPAEGTSKCSSTPPGLHRLSANPMAGRSCSLIRGVPVLTRLGKEVVGIPGIDVVLAGVL